MFIPETIPVKPSLVEKYRQENSQRIEIIKKKAISKSD
jgi:hypothetical protein